MAEADQYVGINLRLARVSALCLVSSAVPAPRHVPARGGTGVSRISAAATAAGGGTPRNSRAGRSSRQKKFSVITLAGSGTASSGVG